MAKNRKNDIELIPVEKRKRVIRVEDRKRRGRKRRVNRIEMAGYAFCLTLLLFVISVGVAFNLLQSHKSKMQDMANNAVPELCKAEDGTYELNWRSLEESGADSYYVNVSTYAIGSENNQRTFFSGYVDGVSCILPDLPTDEGLVLQIDLIKRYSVFGKEHTWKPASIQRFFYIQNPAIKNLDWEVDSDAGTAFVSFDFQGSNSCSIYVTDQDGNRKLLKIVDENNLELNINDEEELWIPTPGRPCILTFVPGNRVNGMALYGGESKEMTVTWEDFAARDIHLSLDVIDGCVGYLEWDELDCDSYMIQMLDGDIGVWETVKTVIGNGECTYISPRLSPGAGYSFRVAAVVGDYVAVSEVCECEIAVTPMYCTVWPVKALKAYSDAAKSEVLCEVEALDAHCVVAVENDMFGINVEGRVLFIDSNYCMINLPEYVGALCRYDITNSYDSIFMAHGFEIPGLTGEIIKGFEDVQLKDGSFLVPLLYPTARKLETAIENAREKGYRLKIYEAFRPHEASVYMYNQARLVQYTILPERTYWGNEPGVYLYVRETDENGAVVERRKTYWELMNDSNNSFTLSNFVSAGTSRHNLGVAMDLTLESLDTGYEVMMQTALHDLSQYSARVQNNEYAKELSRIMMSAGYKDLFSEWWHFQDDEIKNKLSLPCINEGVSPECWMTNGFGWRYRSKEGIYAADCTLNIDGKEYTFDPDGYVQK
ncbi:MAG: D-alanyl-D-alanine carboxypeptidase family protein [Acetatifactor sp.]|nr:D-alanyl-D-alanine carboxypeptidase family protein [Acetatifactor sp.]